MKRSRNAIFKYTIVLGAAMSLSACNGIFENIYDAPIETEMEIKENSFSQVKTDLDNQAADCKRIHIPLFQQIF